MTDEKAPFIEVADKNSNQLLVYGK